VTGKSRGFGFVRYGDRAVQASVFGQTHTVKGRRVELKYPKQVKPVHIKMCFFP
jgi:tRNA(Ser,Leu) C12 N-acetylase TAN1